MTEFPEPVNLRYVVPIGPEGDAWTIEVRTGAAADEFADYSMGPYAEVVLAYIGDDFSVHMPVLVLIEQDMTRLQHALTKVFEAETTAARQRGYLDDEDVEENSHE